MFTPLARWILVTLCVVAGAFLWSDYRLSAIGLFVAALVWAFGHRRYGAVGLAFRAYRSNRHEAMERLLAYTARPELLAPVQRVTYEYLSGIAADRRGDLAAARRHFFFATIARRHNRLRAQAWLQLAHTELLMGDVADARKSVAQAREIAKPELAGPLMQVERAIEGAERSTEQSERT